mgnify:CR=1 FL=1|jgi:hypothetical protein
MADDSGAMATLAFRMSQSSFTGPSSGGGGDGLLSDLNLSSMNVNVGKDTFSHTVSKMIEALGYFESSLSLKSAIGNQASLASLGAAKGNLPGFYSRK